MVTAKKYGLIKLMAEIYYPAKKSKTEKKRVAVMALVLVLAALIGIASWYWKKDLNQWVVWFEERLTRSNQAGDNQTIAAADTAGIWCGKDQCFWFTKEGILTKAAPRPEGNLIVVVDDPDGDIKIGDYPLENRLWQNMALILNSWLVKNWAINKLIVERAKEEAAISANTGFKIYFSLRFNPTTNLKALKKLFDEKKIDPIGLTYTDLRIENKIYYK